MGCLYQLSFQNGKKYIGITHKTAEKRFIFHCYDSKQNKHLPLYRAILAHGKESVTIDTLLIADDWKYLCDLEKKAIVSFGTKSPLGYNATDGGDGASPGSSWHQGFKHSEFQKMKWSIERKGRKHSSSAKEKISLALKGNQRSKGKKHSEETKLKMSLSHIGKPKPIGFSETMRLVSLEREANKRKTILASLTMEEGSGNGR